jgi:sortase (surface protein transpeptidase)
VFAVGIDLRRGALAAPANIARLGWWRDGSDLGSPTGAVLIAGHVDSAKAGPGALFRLRDARRGDRIQVTAKNGRVFGYRIATVQRYVKSRLPTSIYSRADRHRLVLVTCGGPFIQSERHYRDNVVVTAYRG